MARFILDIHEERGITVVMIEHDMGVVMDISHHITCSTSASGSPTGTPDEIRQRPQGDPTPTSARRRGRGRRMTQRARDAGGDDTVPEAPRPQRTDHRRAVSRCARRTAASGRPSPGATTSSTCGASRSGSRARPRAGRQGRHHRRQPPGVVHRRARRAGRRRRVGRPVPGRDLAEVELRHRPLPTRRFIVVEDQEQVDKMLEIRDEAPEGPERHLLRPERPAALRQPAPLDFEAVQELGRALAASSRRFRRARRRAAAPTTWRSSATRPARPGSQGRDAHPRNLLAGARRSTRSTRSGPDDEYLSLPAVRLDRRADAGHLGRRCDGLHVNFPEEPETVTENMREIGPRHHARAAAHLGEPGLHGHVKIRTRPGSSAHVRPVHARRVCRRRPALEKKPVPFGLQVACWLADALVFLPLRDQLGLTNLRSAYTGGAALGPDAFRFFRALGVNLSRSTARPRSAGSLRPPRRRRRRSTRSARPSPTRRCASRTRARSCRAARRCSWATTRTTRPPRRAARWLAALRRRGLLTDERRPHRPRPRQGRHDARGRDPVRAAVHREQAQVLSLRQGGGGASGRTGRSSPRCSASTWATWANGPKPTARLHDLHRPGRKQEVYELVAAASTR